MLKQPAHKTFLDCKLRIMKYMMMHLAAWCEFANEKLGIGLDEKDIIFVSGFLKTTVWAAASFSNNGDNGELLISGGCFVPSASGEFRVSISRGVDASVASRVGPQDRISTWNDDAKQSFKCDQCIFLNYYKMKSRGMLRRPGVMRAAAGPHTLPDQYDDEGSSDVSSSPAASTDTQQWDHVRKVSVWLLSDCFYKIESLNGKCASQQNYDPVNDILDYILKVLCTMRDSHSVEWLTLCARCIEFNC